MLINHDERGYVSLNETTRLIRHVLKESFPRTKFSVRLERYAGGSHVNVRWSDGPTAAQVTAVCDMFKTKVWDSQSESYAYTYRLWQGERISFAGSGIDACREMSDEVRARFRSESENPSEELLDKIRQYYDRSVPPILGPPRKYEQSTIFSYLCQTTSFEETKPCTLLAMLALSQPAEQMRMT